MPCSMLIKIAYFVCSSGCHFAFPRNAMRISYFNNNNFSENCHKINPRVLCSLLVHRLLAKFRRKRERNTNSFVSTKFEKNKLNLTLNVIWTICNLDAPTIDELLGIESEKKYYSPFQVSQKWLRGFLENYAWDESGRLRLLPSFGAGIKVHCTVSATSNPQFPVGAHMLLKQFYLFIYKLILASHAR